MTNLTPFICPRFVLSFHSSANLRFGHIYDAGNDVYRLRYGIENCKERMIDNLTLNQAQELLAAWMSGISRRKLIAERMAMLGSVDDGSAEG